MPGAADCHCDVVMLHDHAHALGHFHKVGKKEVEMAIEARLPDGVVNFAPGSGTVISGTVLKHRYFAGPGSTRMT